MVYILSHGSTVLWTISDLYLEAYGIQMTISHFHQEVVPMFVVSHNFKNVESLAFENESELVSTVSQGSWYYYSCCLLETGNNSFTAELSVSIALALDITKPIPMTRYWRLYRVSSWQCGWQAPSSSWKVCIHTRQNQEVAKEWEYSPIRLQECVTSHQHLNTAFKIFSWYTNVGQMI